MVSFCLQEARGNYWNAAIWIDVIVASEIILQNVGRGNRCSPWAKTNMECGFAKIISTVPIKLSLCQMQHHPPASGYIICTLWMHFNLSLFEIIWLMKPQLNYWCWFNVNYGINRWRVITFDLIIKASMGSIVRQIINSNVWVNLDELLFLFIKKASCLRRRKFEYTERKPFNLLRKRSARNPKREHI